MRLPAWSCGFLSLLLNCFHQLARSRLDWTASLWFGRAGLGPPAMACAVDGLLVAIAEGVSGDDVRYAIAGWSIGGCDVQTSRYAARQGDESAAAMDGGGGSVVRRRGEARLDAASSQLQRLRGCSAWRGVHWHYRNNGAARLFGGEQNAQGAGEEASSWRDRSVGLGRSGRVGDRRRCRSRGSLASGRLLLFCCRVLCCDDFFGLVWSGLVLMR